MPIVRSRHHYNFTVIPNAIFQDETLSIETKGLLCYLLSLPLDWIIRRSQVGETLHIGTEKTARLFAELAAAGYLSRDAKQPPDGKWKEANYTVFDKPNNTAGSKVEQSQSGNETELTALKAFRKNLSQGYAMMKAIEKQ